MTDAGLCAVCEQPLDIGSSVCRACGADGVNDAPLDEQVYIDAEMQLDRLGSWSNIKHDILDAYGSAYTTILRKQAFVKRLVYTDAFAGAGVAEERDTGELIAGSPMRALEIEPPFDELHFIERNQQKAQLLTRITSSDPRAQVHVGESDPILRKVLARCRYKDYARGLCLLDPYGLSVDWSLISEIGRMGSVEIFFNFMIVGANRNVLWSDASRVSEQQKLLMDKVWGDRSWVDAAYRKEQDLFGADRFFKRTNEELISAYCQRLKQIAGFKCVPTPIPMKNTQSSTLYYLIFASPNVTGAKIVGDIFSKYRV